METETDPNSDLIGFTFVISEHLTEAARSEEWIVTGSSVWSPTYVNIHKVEFPTVTSCRPTALLRKMKANHEGR